MNERVAETSFEKVLVANRSEIARRVFAACRRAGLRSVAVFSDPDAEAPFVAEADQAVALGGSTPAESYLDIGKVLDAARLTGADAIHPGYGFLAENAEFARAVIDAGMVWIGPPPDAIEAMGSKVRARALMAEAGVPVVPGAELDEDADAAEIADQIGYPLLVKASAGGGGKGMRPVSEPGELEGALAGAKREAEAAFGDATVFLERYLERPRHIEIQVFADRQGRTVSLGERECSLQRRHQKVVEEAPSVAVGDELRGRLGDAAVAAAEAVGYVGAGTVEFLLDEAGDFYFLEMNTRLQVEHPVTELAYGIDLVAEQFAVASGAPLSAVASAPELRAHAIEVRIYAEDAEAGFLPQTGTLTSFEIPEATPFAEADGSAEIGLRIDSGVEAGSVVGASYDPMLAKLIAWAPSRAAAARRLATALRTAEIDGLVTNRDFLVGILESAEFQAGETDTGLIEREPHYSEFRCVSGGEVAVHAVAAALGAMAARRAEARVVAFAPPGFRNNFSQPQTLSLRSGGEEMRVDYAIRRDELIASVNGESHEEPRLHAAQPDQVDLSVGGVRRRYRVRRAGGLHHVSGPAGQVDFEELPRYAGSEEALAEGALVAPMPGKVLKLVAEVGSSIEVGDVVIVLEAMKMEHELTAPTSGKLAELHIGEGDQVEAGAPLAVIDPVA